MYDPQTRLRATLQFLMTSDIPSEHKSVLIEMLTQVLREHDSTAIRGRVAAQAGGEWHANETAQLHEYLQGRVANSWQQADEVAMHLSAQLHRHPLEIRAKAVELGLGVAVDFRLAKARVRHERD